jgi:hypothetical protein
MNFYDFIIWEALFIQVITCACVKKCVKGGIHFLEEAFGGLIREKGMSIKELEKKLKITSSRKLYFDRIWQYLKDGWGF